MDPISRRKFLKIGGASMALTAAARGAVGAASESVKTLEGQPARGLKKIPTFCDICFWKCGPGSEDRSDCPRLSKVFRPERKR